MATYPNTGQAHTGTYTWGSAKIEYSADGVSWVNLGVARNVAFKENIAKATVQADNSPNIIDRIGEQTVDVSFTLLELYLPDLGTIRGIDSVSAISAGATSDTDVHTTGSHTYGEIIWLDHQGSTVTLPVIQKVKEVTTGNACTTLVSTRDWVVVTDTANHYRRGIVMRSTAQAGTFNDTKGLRIHYNYLAISSRKLTSGGKTELASKYYRLTNKEMVSGVAKYKYFTVYSASISEGINLAFKNSNDADSLLEIPITVHAVVDTDRSEGDQLFAIEDQRATA